MLSSDELNQYGYLFGFKEDSKIIESGSIIYGQEGKMNIGLNMNNLQEKVAKNQVHWEEDLLQKFIVLIDFNLGKI